MQIPPDPPDEQERLRDLYDLCLLDTPPEERFDRLIHIARKNFQEFNRTVELNNLHSQSSS